MTLSYDGYDFITARPCPCGGLRRRILRHIPARTDSAAAALVLTSCFIVDTFRHSRGRVKIDIPTIFRFFGRQNEAVAAANVALVRPIVFNQRARAKIGGAFQVDEAPLPAAR